MKKIGFILLAFCLLIPSLAGAVTHDGKSLYLWGDSAASLGRGGTGVASFGTDLFYLNPASIATAERLGVGVQFGTLQGSYVNPDISFALPTSYGTLGGGVRILNVGNSKNLESAYGISIGGGRDITSRFMLGLALDMVYGRVDGSLFYLGTTLGTIYKLNEKTIGKGFGFFDPRLGASLNLGIPMGSGSKNINFNSLTLGYTFQFFRTKNFNLGWFNDVSAINMYHDYPVKFGLESEILDKYIVRTGTSLPQSYDYGDFTLGLGYKFHLKNFDGTANYTMAHYRGNTFVHYIGVNFEYGELDRQAPETRIAPDLKYVSPNHDGAKDYVTFDLNVQDKSRIKGWKLQVTDPDGKLVREYTNSNRDTIEGLTFKGFFKRLFQRKESQVVPEKVLWDGTDSAGNTVPDNRYSYSFNAWDERDNIAAVKSGVVIIDNTGPAAVLSTDEEKIFSPNGDKKKDSLVIQQKITTGTDDTWQAGFRDASGKIVKSYSWEGGAVPPALTWDGRDDSGAEAPEGVYDYFVRCTDNAGNSASAEVRQITLTRKYEVADIRLPADYFSFAQAQGLNLFPVLSETSGLQSWKIVISDEDKKAVRVISGDKELPKVLTWDCMDAKGKKLEDGVYYLHLETSFVSGNQPASFDKKLVIDSTAPKLSVSHSPDLFSPDGDGENDSLAITTECEESFGIRDWKISIIAPSGAAFKSFSGTGDIPKEIMWDGLGEDKDIVESAADYSIRVEATDMAGNHAVSKPDKLSVDILVVVTERGLKMRISNIEFAFDSATVTKKGTKILDRVYDILQKYEKYDVIVEGHTDDIGDETYNLKLSERRAKSVQDYLVNKGMDQGKMQFIGMGETVPLYPNVNDENRRRNRRVEFLLIKRR